MQIIREPEALRAAVKTLKEGGKSLAFVPTMGALHAGHIQLVTEAARCADAVAASIFVNPMQFGEHEDLDRYPRQEEADAALLSEAGCDLLWLQTAGQIYPDGFATRISVAYGGGSSSFFSIAFEAASVRRSASWRINTRRRPS